MLKINYFVRCNAGDICYQKFLLSHVCFKLSSKIYSNFFDGKLYANCLWKVICNIANAFFQLKSPPKALITRQKTTLVCHRQIG